ncbi:FAD-dependent oxidoreductase [Sphingobium scionense]
MPETVILGAGIQGATLALAAIARGQRPILIDRDDAPAGASVNSYGIIHGGLRYLQSFSIGRWRQSRRAQAWYIDRYPRHVRPLRCVMPLYRGAIRSPALFARASPTGPFVSLAGRNVPCPTTGNIAASRCWTAMPCPQWIWSAALSGMMPN